VCAAASLNIVSEQSKYKGDVRTTRQVAAKDRTPPSVAAIAHGIPDYCWYWRAVSEGTTGPIDYAFTKRRVTLCRAGLPDRTVWLVLKRRLGEQPAYWYSISNGLAVALEKFLAVRQLEGFQNRGVSQIEIAVMA
jgi:hypothetical protein